MIIQGAENFEKQIQAVKDQITTANLRSALNFALDPALKAARAMAPKGSKMHKTRAGRMVAPGFLSRSIFKRTDRNRNNAGAFGVLRLKSEAFYGQFVASGYQAGRRQRTAGGGRVNLGRKILGRPFLRPAVEQNEMEMERRFQSKILANLRKKGIIS